MLSFWNKVQLLKQGCATVGDEQLGIKHAGLRGHFRISTKVCPKMNTSQIIVDRFIFLFHPLPTVNREKEARGFS
jgi:hypothetical protein